MEEIAATLFGEVIEAKILTILSPSNEKFKQEYLEAKQKFEDYLNENPEMFQLAKDWYNKEEEV